MVDKIGSVGSVQGIKAVEKNTEDDKQLEGKSSESVRASDEVSISDEALSLSDVEALAGQTRSYLAENTGETLGRGEQVDTLL